MATFLTKKRGLIAMTLTTLLLVACGGGSSNSADTTPPSVSTFSVKNGAAITAASDASYAVSGNVGTTQEYTLTFSEKLSAASYSVKMLDSSNAQVALPAGMAATLTANDAGNQTYTLTVTTSGSFVFDAGQTSKAVKLQASVADAASNSAKVNVTDTVGDIAPVAGGAFAALADMTVSDNTGVGLNDINAGGVTDTLGRTIVYSATGLPTGVTINASTGVISGAYDAGIPLEPFTVTVTAKTSGGSVPLSKTFILTIRNDG